MGRDANDNAGEDAGGTSGSRGDGEWDPEAVHVREQNAGDLVRGERFTNLGHARRDELGRVDVRGRDGQRLEHLINEGALSGGQEYGAGDCFRDYCRKESCQYSIPR